MIEKETFIKTYESGMTIPEMAKKFNVHEATIKNWAKRLNLSRGQGFKRKRAF